MTKCDKEYVHELFHLRPYLRFSNRFMTLALKLMQELTVERPPRMRQEGKRGWMVEYFKDNQVLTILLQRNLRHSNCLTG